MAITTEPPLDLYRTRRGTSRSQLHFCNKQYLSLLAAAPRRFQVGSLVPSSSCSLPSSRASSSPEAISRPGFPCLLPLRAAPASDLSCQALPRSRRPFVPRSRLWMLEFLRSSLAACFARGLLERSSFFVHAPAVSSCFARGLLERSSFFARAPAVSSFFARGLLACSSCFARGLLECSSCFARGLLARSSCFTRAPAVSLVDLPALRRTALQLALGCHRSFSVFVAPPWTRTGPTLHCGRARVLCYIPLPSPVANLPDVAVSRAQQHAGHPGEASPRVITHEPMSLWRLVTNSTRSEEDSRSSRATNS